MRVSIFYELKHQKYWLLLQLIVIEYPNLRIPSHIPIAYGMRGPSLQMSTMRNMVNDIRNELKERNTSVLCEVYDGQFHQIIVWSQEGHPLTRMQHCQDHFRKIMLANSREELLSILLAYSKISDEDYSRIRETEFNDLEIV